MNQPQFRLTMNTPDISEIRESHASDRFYARARKRVLFIICFGFFLVLLDTTALNIATPALGKEFGDGISDLQWVVNSYTLVFAGLLLAAGAVGDRTGVKRSYQVGLALFTLASLFSAVSPSLLLLILARAFQGLGAAIMLPASLALLSHAFPDPAKIRSAAPYRLGWTTNNWLGPVGDDLWFDRSRSPRLE